MNDFLAAANVTKRPLPYSQRKIQYLMKKVSKAAGLRIRNPHDLRHS